MVFLVILGCFRCFLRFWAVFMKNGQNWSKMMKNDDFLVFLGDFPKSSKKNFIFALIRPFFWGVHRPWNGGSIFGTFGSRPYENLYYVYRFAYYLVTPFFSPRGDFWAGWKKWQKSWFLWFLWFLVFFGHFWCFLVIFGYFRVFGHFGSFLVFFGLFWAFPYNCLGV